MLKFQHTTKESNMCKGGILQFTKALRHECENQTMFGVWHVVAI